MKLKICAAQLQPITGDVNRNIAEHLRMIKAAAAMGAGAVFFPELSLTGYEPTLAKKLAININDNRLDALQSVSDELQLTIGVGAPTQAENGTCISLIIFQPGTERIIYSKQYLHRDEESFFVARAPFSGTLSSQKGIALAICYELSVPAHTQQALAQGADVFVVSVAKSRTGVKAAFATLSATAASYHVPVVMVNCVGKCDDFESAGTSSVWHSDGNLAGRLSEAETALLLYDTVNRSVTKQLL